MAGRHSDYYTLLGIGRGASAGEIDRAYRRAARATHPDIHPDDTSAAERFNAVTLAHATLRDPARRASYDRAHPLLRPAARVHIAAHQRAQPTDPVHLGRHSPQPEPLQPFRASPAAGPIRDDLLELASMLSLLVDGWPFQ